MNRHLNLTVRFLRHATDEGVPCVERDLRFLERAWSVPIEQSAIVLVDCWAEHFIQSHAENSAEIMNRVIGPLLDQARAAGVTVIHAPSPTNVEAYPQWVAYASDRDLGLEAPPPPDAWPPPEFRRREGEYAGFARFPEPKIEAWLTDPSHYRIYHAVAPKPGDFVIKNGDQLHRLLKHRKLLHLFYAGFATNMCVLFRDYGTRAMSQRGYNIILLRDCTMGIENCETVEGSLQTLAAIHSIEVHTGHSTTSAEFVRACEACHD